MGGYVGAALNQRVDAFADRGNRHDFDVVPGEPAVGERAENVVPDCELRGIFAGDAFPRTSLMVLIGESLRTIKLLLSGEPRITKRELVT